MDFLDTSPDNAVSMKCLSITDSGNGTSEVMFQISMGGAFATYGPWTVTNKNPPVYEVGQTYRAFKAGHEFNHDYGDGNDNRRPRFSVRPDNLNNF